MKKSERKSLKEYGRGIIGGLLFSLPLLYTMEVWWTGFIVPSSYLLAALIITYILLLGFNAFAGMRKDSSFLDVCWDAVEEIGLALIVSFLFLLLISQIGFGMSFNEIAGKVIIESMIVAIGISVGTAELGKNGEESSGMEGNEKEEEKVNNGIVELSILSICGAVLFASSVAPTEEILMIGIQSEASHLLLMVVASLLLTAVVLYFSNFQGSGTKDLKLTEMIFEVVICYILALIVSFGFLYFFGRIAGHGLPIIVAQVVVLGIPAAIGAAVGRLLLKG